MNASYFERPSEETALPRKETLEPDSSSEPLPSATVRRFLREHGVKDHNHASEIARIINVDRSQSYRRLKGEVGWNHTDLRAIAQHFGVSEDALLAQNESFVAHLASTGAPGVPATLRIAHLPSSGMLVPGVELNEHDSSDLVAVKSPNGWEIYLDGHTPQGTRRYAVDALTIRSPSHLRVALLEDDACAAQALVEAFRPYGIAAIPFADSASLLSAFVSHRFDAFVLDWLLSDGTAARVVEAIRQQRSHMPILVVTGALMADSEMEKTLIELSAQWNFSTLDKPVRPMNLANAIKQLVAAARP